MKWIDAKKKKPKIGQTVLIVETNIIKIANYNKHTLDKRKCVFGDNRGGRYPWIYTDVTHWMPLPKLPREPK